MYNDGPRNSGAEVLTHFLPSLSLLLMPQSSPKIKLGGLESAVSSPKVGSDSRQTFLYTSSHGTRWHTIVSWTFRKSVIQRIRLWPTNVRQHLYLMVYKRAYASCSRENTADYAFEIFLKLILYDD